MLKRRRGPLKDGNIVEEKKVRFSEVDSKVEEEEEATKQNPDNKSSRFKSKHSLDSDEEDEVKDVGQLHDDELDGEEDTTVMFDDGIQITPFNMKEEMEDGHFDRDGNYYEKKDPNLVEDSWLQDVDWDKVDELQQIRAEKERREQEQAEAEEEKVDKVTALKQLLEILTPGESVSKALRRLGGGKKTSTRDRWSKKKEAATKAANRDSSPPSKRKKEQAEGEGVGEGGLLNKLTSLADSLLAFGEYDVYQFTFESVKFKIEKESEMEDDDDLDKLGDALDSGKNLTEIKTGQSSQSESKKSEVMWEFRWKNEDNAPVYGPYSSQHMSSWMEEGYFKDAGAWARQIGDTQKPFYSTRRIDFDLYT